MCSKKLEHAKTDDPSVSLYLPRSGKFLSNLTHLAFYHRLVRDLPLHYKCISLINQEVFRGCNDGCWAIVEKMFRKLAKLNSSSIDHLAHN